MQIIEALGTPKSLTDYEGIVERLDDLGAVPAVVQKLLAATADDDFDMDEVQALVASDPVIAARLLKIASSPVYSPRPVQSLRMAMLRIGMRDIRKFVMTSALVGAKKLSPFRRRHWEYSLTVGATCEAIASVKALAVDDPFLCGMLHDFGTLLFESALGKEYRKQVCDPGRESQVHVERALFGFDHTDLGALLVRKWRLFPALEAVMQLHHDPRVAMQLELPPAYAQAVTLVTASRIAVVGEEFFEPEIVDDATERLGIDPGEMAELALVGEERFESIYRSLLG